MNEQYACIIVYPYNKRTNSIESVTEMIQLRIGRVLFVSQQNQGPLSEILDTMSIDNQFLGIGEIRYRNLYRLAFYIVKLRKIFKAYRVQKVIAHQQISFLASVVASWQLKPLEINYFRHNTNEDYLKNTYKATILNYLCNRLMRRAFAPSEKNAKFWIKEPGMKKKEVNVAPYLYNFLQFDRLRSEKPNASWHQLLKGFLHNSNPDLVIISLSRLTRTKCVHELIQLVYRAEKEDLNIHLINFGDGECRLELDQLSASLRITEKVTLLPFLNNPYPFFKIADCYISMSISEASNSAAKEAAYLGLPVIVKNQAGDFGEYMKTDNAGYLLCSDDPVGEALVHLRRLRDRPESVMTNVLNLKKLVHERFSISRFDDTYKFLFE